MKNKICTIDNILRWSLLMIILSLVLACGGGGNGSSRKTKSGQLTVDESLLPEQQIELYTMQTDEFAKAIVEEGACRVLGKIYDDLFYVFYANSNTYYNCSFESGALYAMKPPIFCKDIKTGKIQEVSIPQTIDSQEFKVNLILDYICYEGKILMIVTGKNPEELYHYSVEPVNVICFDGNDFSFNYIVGGHPWRMGNEEIFRYDANIGIPFSQIFDGTYKNNPAYLDLNNDQDSIKSNSQSDIPNEGIGEELRE